MSAYILRCYRCNYSTAIYEEHKDRWTQYACAGCGEMHPSSVLREAVPPVVVKGVAQAGDWKPGQCPATLLLV